MKKLTIFTPTYNRADKLKKAYESLINQTCNNFIWLIVDDGSKDGTELLVKKWIKDKKIDILYYQKDNGGKHTAYNYALDKITTEYAMISLDSDDWLTKDAVEFTLSELKTHKNEAGIVTLWKNIKNNSKPVHYDISKLQGKSLSWALSNNLLSVEATFTFKIEYLKNFKFPIFSSENFFTEAYVYYQMEEPMYWTNKVTKEGTYLENGLTNNTKKLFVKNPNSWYLYNKLRVEKNKSFTKKIKYMIYYIAFGLLAKRKHILIDIDNKLLFIICFPAGLVGYLYLKKECK